MEAARKLGLRVRSLPRLLELVDGQVSLPKVRDINVSDIIGRNPECPDLDLPEDYISGRTILVTGAGGSIGSEICRQLCRYQPQRIILMGRGENRIHSIYYELKAKFPEIQFEPVIGNVTNPTAVSDVLHVYRPQVIFHAAAHKHVFLMECNPVEAALNNILGTALLADLAGVYGVERFVMISTDKATDPTCVMGATKAFCERLVAHHNASSRTTRYVSVRFGNVLGSAGSVVPIFQKLVEQGQPITVTHPEIDRYFMTIEEASFLVLQAGAIGEGGEVFVLDMGDPVKIVDIARTIIKLHGKNPDAPEAIEFIGLRPGEKLHETLVSAHEALVETDCHRIRRVKTNGRTPQFMELTEALAEIRAGVEESNELKVLRTLSLATNSQFNEDTLRMFRNKPILQGLVA